MEIAAGLGNVLNKRHSAVKASVIPPPKTLLSLCFATLVPLHRGRAEEMLMEIAAGLGIVANLILLLVKESVTQSFSLAKL